ncbi:MAG: TIGR01777 family oxidoreductase [Chloroflexota bacterium]
MNIIITGGTGLIGRELVEHLATNGHEVTILSRNPASIHGLPSRVRLKQWDTASATGWGNLVNTTDAIVNLAGENLAGLGFFPRRWTKRRKCEILQSRLNAGKALVEAVKAATTKPKVLIQMSAVGYYGTSLSNTFTEGSPQGNDFLADICQQWEASTSEIRGLGVRYVVTRTGMVITPKGGALMRMILPHTVLVDGPFGNGKQWYSWIHIKDVARAIRYLIEDSHTEGVYNLTAPHPLTNTDFSKCLGRVLHRPSWLPVSAFVMRLLFGEVASIVLEGQRVLPKRLLAAGFEFEYPEAETALRDLLSKA